MRMIYGLAAVLVLVLAAVYWQGRQDGKTGAEFHALQEDIEDADRIRDRVLRGLSERVRDFQARGFRD